MPMDIVMPTVSLHSHEELACGKCGRRASFLTPIGLFCPTDALIAAAFHNWIPTRIRDGMVAGADPSQPDTADS